MDKNKLVLRYCPNFERIINFDYYEEDMVTAKLISIYEKFIFSSDIYSDDDISLIRDIDHVIGKYIDDYAFRKEMQVEIFKVKVKKTCTNVLRAIVEGIVQIFEKFEMDSTRNIYISRWI